MTPYEQAAAELRERELPPHEIEAILLRRAHGHLRAGLASLVTAASFFEQLEPATGVAIMKQAERLARLAPDYVATAKKSTC